MAARRRKSGWLMRWGCTIAVIFLIVAWPISPHSIAFVGLDKGPAVGVLPGGLILGWGGDSANSKWIEAGIQRNQGWLTFPVQWWPGGWRPSGGGYVVFIPFWMILLVLAPSTWVLWRSHVRTRRVELNHCSACDYNLAGLSHTKGQRTCPECGKVAPADAS